MMICSQIIQKPDLGGFEFRIKNLNTFLKIIMNLNLRKDAEVDILL